MSSLVYSLTTNKMGSLDKSVFGCLMKGPLNIMHLYYWDLPGLPSNVINEFVSMYIVLQCLNILRFITVRCILCTAAMRYALLHLFR